MRFDKLHSKIVHIVCNILDDTNNTDRLLTCIRHHPFRDPSGSTYEKETEDQHFLFWNAKQEAFRGSSIFID